MCKKYPKKVTSLVFSCNMSGNILKLANMFFYKDAITYKNNS